MNKYFSKFIQFMKQNKLLLVILIIIVVFLLSKSRIIEGLTNSIGEYDYLAPPATPYVFDNDTAKKIVANDAAQGNTTSQTNLDNWDKPNPNVSGKTYADTSTEGLNKWYANFLKDITQDDVDYFIANGKWPWDNFVTNKYIDILKKTNPNITDNELEQYKTNVEKMFPNRSVYGMIITDKNNDDATTKPVGYQIYMGTAQPPSSSSSTLPSSLSDLSSNIPSSSTVSPSDSDNLYGQCTKFCEKLK